MKIPNFSQFINEAFIADVDDAEISKNTLDIELPDSKERRMFKLKDGEAMEVTEDNPEGEKIDDLKLRKFVLNAIRGIKNIKEQSRANEIERISGGDSNIIKEIEKLYDNNDETHIIRVNTPNSDNNGKPEMYSLWEEIKDLKNPGDWKYISFSKKGTKNKLNSKQKECFKLSGNTVGKGEYFLPIIYPDVYKNKSYGYEDNDETFTKGDNRLKVDDEFYELELKSGGACGRFENYRRIPSKYNKKENYNDFKNAVVGSLTRYMYTRNYKGRKTYFILFDNKCSNSYKERASTDVDGFFVLFVGDTVSYRSDISIIEKDGYKKIFKSLEDKVEISNDFYYNTSSNQYNFIYEYSKESGKIIVYLGRNYSDDYKGESDLDKVEKNKEAIDLLKNGYSQRDVSQKTGVALAIVNKLNKNLIDSGFNFDKVEKKKIKSESKQKIKELKEEIEELTKKYSDIYKLGASLNKKIQKKDIDILSEDERNYILSDIENDRNIFNDSIKDKKIKKGKLKELEEDLDARIITKLIIEGYTLDEIKSLVGKSTQFINKIYKIVKSTKEVKIKEHPSIVRARQKVSEIKEERAEILESIKELESEIEKINNDIRKEFLKLASEGKHAEQIAKIMGENSQTIRNWANKEHIELKKGGEGRPKKNKIPTFEEFTKNQVD